MKDRIKLFNTLSLAASDTREETLKTIIINALYENEKEISKEELLESIDILFDLDPYLPEFDTILQQLKDMLIVSENAGKLTLSSETKNKIKEQYQHYSLSEIQRYRNFCQFIKSKFTEISDQHLRQLWDAYLEYLINCFYYYGEKALLVLNPDVNQNSDDSIVNIDLLRNIYLKLNDEFLVSVLKFAIDNYADSLTSEDLDYLDGLAQKTLAFTSLGYDPKSINSIAELNLIDWIIYLDTNVLFSLLDLHVHPENEACKNLIKLIKENKNNLKIEFRVSELTIKELNGKKSDFDDLDINLTTPAIKALLRSNRLDEFSRKFYESLLNHRDETIDPKEIIDLAPVTLERGYSIKISRNRKQVDALGESYVESKIQDYLRFVQEKNDFRQSFADQHKIKLRELYKTDNQARHDVILREFIIDARFSKMRERPKAFTDLKYFAISLDDVLIAYDKNCARTKDSEFPFPVFFKPSFLLNKLIRLLPIKITSDYKKAFFKALSSRGFNKDIRQSRDIQRIVNYLKAHGIDNENVILNLLSEDLFLEKFHELQNNPNELDKFFENELNKQLDTIQAQLNETKNRISTLESSYQSKESQVSVLTDELGEKETSLKMLNTALSQFTKKIEILEKKGKEETNQLTIGFDASSSQDKITSLELQLKKEYQEKRDNYLKGRLAKWRLNTWLILIFSFLIITIGFLILIGSNNWDINTTFMEIISTPENKGYYQFLKILGAVCFIVFEYFVIKNLYSKYCDFQNINAFKQGIKFPDDLNKY